MLSEFKGPVDLTAVRRALAADASLAVTHLEALLAAVPDNGVLDDFRLEVVRLALLTAPTPGTVERIGQVLRAARGLEARSLWPARLALLDWHLDTNTPVVDGALFSPFTAGVTASLQRLAGTLPLLRSRSTPTVFRPWDGSPPQTREVSYGERYLAAALRSRLRQLGEPPWSMEQEWQPGTDTFVMRGRAWFQFGWLFVTQHHELLDGPCDGPDANPAVFSADHEDFQPYFVGDLDRYLARLTSRPTPRA